MTISTQWPVRNNNSLRWNNNTCPLIRIKTNGVTLKTPHQKRQLMYQDFVCIREKEFVVLYVCYQGEMTSWICIGYSLFLNYNRFSVAFYSKNFIVSEWSIYSYNNSMFKENSILLWNALSSDKLRPVQQCSIHQQYTCDLILKCLI